MLISLDQLSRAMYLGELGEQIVLKSRKAFDKLSFVGAVPVLSEEFFPRKKKRDMDAREHYRDCSFKWPSFIKHNLSFLAL